MDDHNGRPLAVTMGEPAGIGGEIALKAWLARDTDIPTFFLVDDPGRLDEIGTRNNWPVPIRAIESPARAHEIFPSALPVLPITVPTPVQPSRPAIDNASAVLESIDRAVACARSGAASAVVTNPIHKHTLLNAGFKHPGHTEYLAEIAGRPGAGVMMLVSGQLRVVPVTVHIPLARVPTALTTGAIVRHGLETAFALRYAFGIPSPHLVVAGLNPHAGEYGDLGSEEEEIILPAIEQLRDRGISVDGPAPADSLFHESARSKYDAVLCMYHDQALIPLKTLDFDGGVNVTLGLPFIRTSPDHGTAFDIAGTGRASARSLIEALRLAAAMAARAYQTRAS